MKEKEKYINIINNLKIQIELYKKLLKKFLW